MWMQVDLRELTRIAYNVIREACRLGVPLYAEVKTPGVVRVETRHGSDEYVVFVLINPVGDETSLVMGKPWDFVTIARVRLRDGSVEMLEYYVDQVPYALATNPRVMPDYEADTWAQRLRLLRNMEPCEDEPGLLCSGENPCVRAARDEHGVYMWLDVCAGIREDSRYWQARMGLRPGSPSPPSRGGA